MTEDARPTTPTAGSASHDIPPPSSLRIFMEGGWSDDGPVQVERAERAGWSARRREALIGLYPGEALVIPTGPMVPRANDTDYAFRPGSDFFWLTGDLEPDDVLVIADGEATLYVPPRADRSSPSFYADRKYGELWVGPRWGLAETAQALDIRTADLGDLPKVLGELDRTRTLLLRGVDARVDDLLPAPVTSAGQLTSEGAVIATEGAEEAAARRDQDFAITLSELRLIKDEHEIRQLDAAVAATVIAFEDVVAALPEATRFGRGERWIEGTFNRRARLEGNDVGYGSICACGPHATILHWVRNDGVVRDGDLLLLDAGVEGDELYTADVTRTMPISGRWTPAQRRLYDLVLAGQRAGLEAVKPGAAFLDPHRAAMKVIAAGLAEWGILPVPAEQSLQEDPTADGAGLHRRWTLHGVSHMLGLDVHDCAKAREETYHGGTLAAGMVLTVEPGLYFQPDDLVVPAELRGIGIRIEDDVLVTEDGYRVLSAALPTDPDEIEAWMARVQAP
jgi:Xaa-Pro aminopeptidase